MNPLAQAELEALPGNRADVLLTTSGTDGHRTTTLMGNVMILAVDPRIVAAAENRVDPNQLTSVTLLVTPDQANMLALGQIKGILHLSLLGPEADQPADPRPRSAAGRGPVCRPRRGRVDEPQRPARWALAFVSEGRSEVSPEKQSSRRWRSACAYEPISPYLCSFL
jgi:Flp pilus assembly protein CpaB